MRNSVKFIAAAFSIGIFTLSMSALGAGNEQFTGEFPVVSSKGVLTVSGNGKKYREVYQSGEQPTLSAYMDDSLLPDGQYKYQFRSTPSGSVATNRQQGLLKNGTPTVTNTAPGAAVVISGKFEVQNGQLIFR